MSPAATSKALTDDSVTFQWFVEECYLPMRQETWSPAYRKINSYEIKHYLVEHFGRIPLGQLGTFEIQVWLNKLATRYSQSVVRHCHINIRSITHMAVKLNFLVQRSGRGCHHAADQTGREAADDAAADSCAHRWYSRSA